jgi:hypothetical protein
LKFYLGASALETKEQTKTIAFALKIYLLSLYCFNEDDNEILQLDGGTCSIIDFFVDNNIDYGGQSISFVAGIIVAVFADSS